jgi:tRNA nucleotidyltransferase (CCA-adding enzyme)
VPNSKNIPQPDSIRSQLKAKVSKSVWELLETLAICADNLKMDVYLVGGCIRDFLLDAEAFDWDIVVQGDGPELGEAIAAKLGREIQKKSQFLTCTVILENKNKLDIATTRSEIYKHAAALPEVQKSSIDDDLFRRDFTINAMALKLNGQDSFSLIDKYNGLEDLNAGLIRILHSKSFLDDPTRAFRAIRYEKRFGFSLQSVTNQLLKEAIDAKVFDRLSGFRVFNELKRTLKEKQPPSYVQRYREIGLLQCIHPALLDSDLSKNLLEAIQKGFQKKEQGFIDLNLKPWKTYFLGLLYPLGDLPRRECLSRLDIKGKEANAILEHLAGIENALTSLALPNNEEPIIVFETLNNLSAEAIFILLVLAKVEGVKTSIYNYYSLYRDRAKTYVTGDDLIHLGFSPGPIFQKILYNLKKVRLNGDLNSKNDEIEWIKKNFKP